MVTWEGQRWTDPIVLSIVLFGFGVVGLLVGLYLPLVVLPASFTGPTDWPGFHALNHVYSTTDAQYLLVLGGLVTPVLVAGWRRSLGAITIVVGGYISYREIWRAIDIAVNEPFEFGVGTYVVLVSGLLLVTAGAMRVAIGSTDHWVVDGLRSRNLMTGQEFE